MLAETAPANLAIYTHYLYIYIYIHIYIYIYIYIHTIFYITCTMIQSNIVIYNLCLLGSAPKAFEIECHDRPRLE